MFSSGGTEGSLVKYAMTRRMPLSPILLETRYCIHAIGHQSINHDETRNRNL